MPNLFKYIPSILLVCLYINNSFCQTKKITRVEYYLDKDPGYGKAEAAVFTQSSSVNTSFDVRVDTLSPGLHIVGVRSLDDSGSWSFDERWLILKQLSSLPPVNITKAEWYIDTDPGYGKAIDIILPSPATNLIDLSFTNTRLDTLLPGLHIFGVRSRDANGTWSFDERWLILKPTASTDSVNITKSEWYIDKDPGYGKGYNINLSPGIDLIDLSFSNTKLDTLLPGLHIFGVRSQDANGAWSFDERWLILKPATPDSVNIAKAEWYIDKDPGYGKANDINLSSPGNELIDLSFTNTRLDTLFPGLHIFGVRSQDANGAWSFDERWLILKQAPSQDTANMKRIEYYIDADPGWGKGIPLAFLPGKDIVAPPAFINITGLAAGTHKLLIRSQDANNLWSFDDTVSFTIGTLKATPFINVNSVAFTNVCSAGSFTLGYHATGPYNTGNQFIVEISDAQGSFASAQTIGRLSSVEKGGLIQCNMPGNIQQGSGFKMRVRSTNPPVIGDGSDQSLSVSIGNFFLGNDTFKIVACAEAKIDLTQFYDPANSTVTWSVGNPTAAPVGIHSIYAINSVGCKDTAIININLPTATWTGTVSKNWHTPGNWSTAAIPVDTTHVIIPAGTQNPCEISTADATAASVHVKGEAAQLRILGGRKLLIKSNCTEVAKIPE